MSLTLDWKAGFEIELMAPAGTSRRDLAERIAQQVNGRTVRVFHADSEPAKVPGTPIFENLTPGFRVENESGEWVASFVDDLTLQADLDRTARPKAGWYRIVSDDKRILDLIERHCDAEAQLDTVLEPFAALFGTKIDVHPSGMFRVPDKRGGSIAMGATLPGERERPCEIVTAPLVAQHHEALCDLLENAVAMGFSLPRESATHIHFDAKPLRSAAFIARFVTIIEHFGSDLRRLVKVNPACVRLGQYPPELLKAVVQPDFVAMSWDETRAALTDLQLTKYCDYNLVNMINQDPAKDTLEIRILPGMIDAGEIMRCAMLFEALLKYCCEPAKELVPELPASLAELIGILPLQSEVNDFWLERA